MSLCNLHLAAFPSCTLRPTNGPLIKQKHTHIKTHTFSVTARQPQQKKKIKKINDGLWINAYSGVNEEELGVCVGSMEM